MIKVLIAANEPIFRIGLKKVLKDDLNLNIVEETNLNNDILNFFNIYKPDLIILSLESNSLLEFSQDLKKITKKSKVIIFSSFVNKEIITKIFEQGVSSYLLKESSVSEIKDALVNVITGKTFVNEQVRKLLSENTSNTNELLKKLTKTEISILNKVSEYKSSKDISKELFITEKTVYNHRMNMTKKLNLKGKNALLKFALEVNLK
jgi:two-component system response regulator DegU